MHRVCSALLLALGLASCGGPDTGLGFGSGGDGGGLGGPGGALGQAVAPYLILDLDTSTVTLHQTVDDLTTNPAYRTTQVVFRRITGLGSDFYIGVFECTQGQWKTLTLGAKPWTNIDDSILDSATFDADDRPAYNLSHSLILSVLNGYNVTASVSLVLPTLTQWRHACAGGTSTTWSWGDTVDGPTVATHAATYDSQSAPNRGPEVVASHQANAFGLFDMHGNVWEWSGAGTHVMGGSWHDSVQQARTQNVAGVDNPELDVSTSHALIGCRLVLIP